MRKILIAWLLGASVAYGATNTMLMTGSTVLRPTSAEPLTWENANTFSGNVTATGITLRGTSLMPAAWGSGYLHGPTQAFTAAGGYEIVTGYVGVGSANMGTLTSSNLSVIVTGWYRLSGSFALYSSADLNEVIVHGFTNGVFAENLGGSRYFEKKDQYGTIVFGGIIRMVSNDYIDLKIDVSQNCDLVFEHGDATLNLVGP